MHFYVVLQLVINGEFKQISLYLQQETYVIPKQLVSDNFIMTLLGFSSCPRIGKQYASGLRSQGYICYLNTDVITLFRSLFKCQVILNLQKSSKRSPGNFHVSFTEIHQFLKHLPPLFSPLPLSLSFALLPFITYKIQRPLMYNRYVSMCICSLIVRVSMYTHKRYCTS